LPTGYFTLTEYKLEGNKILNGKGDRSEKTQYG